jgi:hypothetical protein
MRQPHTFFPRKSNLLPPLAGDLAIQALSVGECHKGLDAFRRVFVRLVGRGRSGVEEVRGVNGAEEDHVGV